MVSWQMEICPNIGRPAIKGIETYGGIHPICEMFVDRYLGIEDDE